MLGNLLAPGPLGELDCMGIFIVLQGPQQAGDAQCFDRTAPIGAIEVFLLAFARELPQRPIVRVQCGSDRWAYLVGLLL